MVFEHITLEVAGRQVFRPDKFSSQVSPGSGVVTELYAVMVCDVLGYLLPCTQYHGHQCTRPGISVVAHGEVLLYRQLLH